MSFELLLKYLFSPEFFHGALVTLEITIGSLIVGGILGLCIALLQETHNKIGDRVCWVYLWIFRGTPVLFQIIFVYNVLPSFGIRLSAITSGILALALNEGAYMAEIIRAGLQAVTKSQRTAGLALGLTPLAVMRYVVIPQAIRTILPPMGNQVIGMLKTSALVSVIAVQDLLLVANQTASASFRYFEALSAAGIYYLVLTSFFMICQRYIERRMDPKYKRHSSSSFSTLESDHV